MVRVRQQTRSGRRRDPSKLTYSWYINSSAWERRKVAYYAHHLKKCRACGSTENIHLHHHTYKRMGEEHDDDLIPLCQDHHDAVHKLHRSVEFTGTLTQATRVVIGGPLHPRKRKNVPRTSVRRQRPQRRSKPKPSPKNKPAPGPEIAIGLRVIIKTDSKPLSWANGKHGVICEVISPTLWRVELDGRPDSRLSVTAQMVQRVT